jgi:hypothetical protein
MDNQISDAQREHEREVHSDSVVVQNIDSGGGNAGVLAAVALVAIILLGIWWFGFGPGTGSGTTTTPENAPPAASTAPLPSVPPAQ